MWYSAIEFGIGRSIAEGKNLLVVTVSVAYFEVWFFKLEIICICAIFVVSSFIDDLGYTNDFTVVITNRHAHQGVRLVARLQINVLIKPFILQKKIDKQIVDIPCYVSIS